MMDNVIRVGWYVDDDGRTYLGRLTDKSRKIEPNTRLKREARKAARELVQRLGHAQRQA
jgi:hypothetical protein